MIFPRSRMSYHVYVDFDGTQLPCDTADDLLERFALPARRDVEAEWATGRFHPKAFTGFDRAPAAALRRCGLALPYFANHLVPLRADLEIGVRLLRSGLRRRRPLQVFTKCGSETTVRRFSNGRDRQWPVRLLHRRTCRVRAGQGFAASGTPQQGHAASRLRRLVRRDGATSGLPPRRPADTTGKRACTAARPWTPAVLSTSGSMVT